MENKKAQKEIVEEFLKQLREKIKVFGIVFRPRDKNTQSLADLEISARQREKYIQGLTYKNYVSGPMKDSYDITKPDYFEFGLKIKGQEVYIKLSPGQENKPVDCMSFHIAEFPIKYPQAEV